jgi:hypothetical protein
MFAKFFLAALAVVAMVGCKKSTDKVATAENGMAETQAKKLPAPTESPEDLRRASEEMSGDQEAKKELEAIDKNPISAEWKAIWSQPEELKALREFQKKHGMFIETSEEKKPLSVYLEDGPCGGTYMSLLKNAKDADEAVWEIDSKGKILREWHPGSAEVIGFDKNNLYRRITYWEVVSDLSPTKQRESKVHDYILSIGADNSIETLPSDTKIPNGWDLNETTCPEGTMERVKSDYAYCVREKKSKRLFVLQHPCT